MNTQKSSPCNVPGQDHDIERTTGGGGPTVCQDQAVLWTDLCVHCGKFGMDQLLHVLIAEWFNMKGGPCSTKAQKELKTVHTVYFEIFSFQSLPFMAGSFRGQNLSFQLLSWQKVQKSFCMYMYTDNCFQIVYSNCALHHSGDISILLLFLWYHSCDNLNKKAWTVSLSYNDLDLPPGLRTGLFISRHNDPDIHR